MDDGQLGKSKVPGFYGKNEQPLFAMDSSSEGFETQEEQITYSFMKAQLTMKGIRETESKPWAPCNLNPIVSFSFWILKGHEISSDIDY